jgi:hypothetical protein
MTGIQRLVLDVVKPINMPSTALAAEISHAQGVESVDVFIQQVEQKVESAKVTIEGSNMLFDEIKEIIEKLGATVQSVDRVTAGKRIVP